MKKLKRGLIIQGPIISIGRTGKTASITFSQVKKEHIVKFNCIDNIVKIFNTYQSVFDHIVCVSWEGQDPSLIEKLKDLIPDGCLLIIKDTTKKINPKGKVIPGNNKYRQFLSIYEGSKVLSELGCSYIAKIRSDQYFDLELLMNDAVYKLENEKRSVVLVPWANIKNSFSVFEIPDHYFVARAGEMLAFSKEYLDLPEITAHIHTDIFYKWRLRSYCNISLVKSYIYFFGRFGNNTLMSLFINNKVSKGFFIPLDGKILKNFFWRGERLIIDDYFFSDLEIDYAKVNRTNLGFVSEKIIRKLARSITKSNTL
jgi:hypothetical protein